VFTDRVLMAVVLVTALAGAAQFTLFSYMAAYFRQMLAATPAQIAGLFWCSESSGWPAAWSSRA
jgi:hypothetical protein